ncbi:hypothetical protein J2S88_001052 [Agrobacterium tumefaciens]|nr:hypothetical protein [Agrobacterium tumefaciens]MDP9976441.1 hypothetical protein [Agrobacterium tumefaciens]
MGGSAMKLMHQNRQVFARLSRIDPVRKQPIPVKPQVVKARPLASAARPS